MIKHELPTIVSASPSVSGLMKFEEVPVSNYTGIPDISLPILNFNTISKEVDFGLNLQYHPSSIAYDEISGDVGLGWSLTSTNAISRTVRGLPDELFFGSGQEAKIGIYYNFSQNNIFNYYQVEKYLKNETSYGQYYDEFLYDANIAGRLDSEHDLYQFNFFGKSGRFIIKKNDVTGNLEIVRLDSNKKIKIELNYTFQNGIYSIDSFIAFDEKGIKYIFDIIESTEHSSMNESTYFDGQLSMNIDREFNSKSAFNLSKVVDNNNKEIINCNYQFFNEIVINGTVTSYFPEKTNIEANDFFSFHTNPYWTEFNFKQLGPSYVTSASQRTITVPKLSNIEVKNKGNIIFEYESERLDSNINNNSSAVKLKKLKLFDNYNNLIKEFVFDYIYREHNTSGTDLKRMFLNSLVEKNPIDSKENRYNFYYQNNDALGQEIFKDSWGYFNLLPVLNNGGFYRDVDPVFCTTDVLKKIEYPTGGVKVFNFESNTYSFEGQVELLDFDTNPENWEDYSTFKNFNSINNNLTSFFSLQNQATEVFFSTQIGFPTNDWWFHIYKDIKSPSTRVFSISLNSVFNNNGFVKAPDLEPGNYLVEFTVNDPPVGNTTINSTINAFYKLKVNSANYKNYLYGGGVRIKNIQSFQNLFSSNHINSETFEQTDFIYALETNNSKSSGSLVFPKPKFSYTSGKNFHIKSGFLATPNNITFRDTFFVQTTSNSLSHIRTQGSDIGYKNVKVLKRATNNSNGYIKYEYTSPIDYPEELVYNNLNYPFLPTSNFDYKRGLLSKQSIFNESGTIIKEINNIYEFNNESENITGIKIYSMFNCPFTYLYPTYFNYNSTLQHCISNNNCISPEIFEIFYDSNNLTCLDIHDFMQADLIYTATGTALLKSTETKDYYSNGINNPKIIEHSENYSYDNNDLLISKTKDDGLNGLIIENYNYHSGNSIYSQNRIAEIEKIETYRDNVLLSTSEIEYSNNWSNNVSYLPNTIKTKKGTSIIEDRIKYNQYNDYGNPLEVQQEDGMLISYIWGYNKTQPVAKLENIAYNSIPSNHIQAIETASNANNEANLISALNALRNNPALSNTMITTYTYKPLVGVSSITDSKGNIITYHYDSFGRLEFVKDKDGNILSENEYHYRTQN